MAPNYSSPISTIGNTVGAVAGILGPIIVAALTEAYPGAWGWRAAFLLTTAMCVVATVVWLRVMTFDIVPVLNSPCASSK